MIGEPSVSSEGAVEVDGDVEETWLFCGREVLGLLVWRVIRRLCILNEIVFWSMAVTPEREFARSPWMLSVSFDIRCLLRRSLVPMDSGWWLCFWSVWADNAEMVVDPA